MTGGVWRTPQFWKIPNRISGSQDILHFVPDINFIQIFSSKKWLSPRKSVIFKNTFFPGIFFCYVLEKDHVNKKCLFCPNTSKKRHALQKILIVRFLRSFFTFGKKWKNGFFKILLKQSIFSRKPLPTKLIYAKKPFVWGVLGFYTPIGSISPDIWKSSKNVFFQKMAQGSIFWL